jgi:hypothetical protein
MVGMGPQAYRKRHRFGTLVVLALSIVVASGSACAGRRFDALMRSWEGQSADDLYRTWGPPNYVYSNGAGGRVAVYVPVTRPGASRTSPESERVRASASQRAYDPAMKAGWPIFRIFFIDDKGRVRQTEWRGRWECCGS